MRKGPDCHHFESITVATMTWLTIIKCVSQMTSNMFRLSQIHIRPSFHGHDLLSVFCEVFCGSLFVFLSVVFWPLQFMFLYTATNQPFVIGFLQKYGILILRITRAFERCRIPRKTLCFLLTVSAAIIVLIFFSIVVLSNSASCAYTNCGFTRFYHGKTSILFL